MARSDWTFEVNEAELDRLFSPEGDVGRYLGTVVGPAVAGEAKRLAPVSADGSNGRRPGWLRDHIDSTVGEDGEGVYVDIATPARSPGGAPYGLFQEVGTRYQRGTPHIRPAFNIL